MFLHSVGFLKKIKRKKKERKESEPRIDCEFESRTSIKAMGPLLFMVNVCMWSRGFKV